MKRITFRADARHVEAARERACAENTTLNEQFRMWLQDYVRQPKAVEQSERTMKALQTRIKTGGRKFTRDEMNER